MAIPLSRLDLGMPQQVLHLIKRPSGVDQKRGKAVPQVMHPDIGQPRSRPCRIPRTVDSNVGLLGLRISKHPRTPLDPGNRLEHRNSPIA